MERVVEPELMDEDEQARAYSEADFAAPHDRFVELLAAAVGGKLVGPVLDLGCGPGDITVRVAKRFPGVAIHGVDGSAAMLKYGHARLAKEKLTGQVTLAQALLPRDAPPLPTYATVISNSLLHHLHDPSVMWSIVNKHAHKGGALFIMDLMRPSTMADVDRLVADNSKGEPEVLVKDFHASLCAAFTVDEVKAQLQAAKLGHLKVEAVSDRHLTITGAP